MLYEDTIASFPALVKRLGVLDQDSGVRLIGESGGKKIYAFVTRFGPKYTLMTYTLGKGGAPGRRIQTLEFEGLREIEETLKMLAKGRLRAWIY
ncbi:MAG: hypothetical protein JRN13_07235 [Nitrososphaerota archaeon]|nr:hypothetical protein [Nitrososphaerota archaeon]MDG6956114.1 hypothetical protein [Nitrososphaerota archaeon]MDG6957670.1 hypothetical protein [Nitrososphaerota archaeon]MDG6960152.1 hypothetical protein [Nitrososphaerota archaeon]MDG6965924.1 hypothetical protein [Nitrososphaerota archaeon]